MTQLTEEHFELHSKNKAEQYERQKIKFLEDRINTLEKSLGRVIDIVMHNSGDALEDLKKDLKESNDIKGGW
tara:strand:- start:63 stop:278 length:216 start_codon:yes stop_codon:yes gene_type:complete